MSAAPSFTHAVFGRERELAAGTAFLDALREASGALLIEGEPGIGKSTVWSAIVRSADAGSVRVLQARPAESEARLSYAALADLVGPVFDATRARLPAPQEHALAATLLRVASAEPADPRTTATAVVGVLGALARERPVLIAIDDVQWVDAASCRALEFVARRLPSRVGLLLTRRTGCDATAPLDLDGAITPERIERLIVGPLSLASLHHVIANRLDRSFGRPVLARIADASGGNPFFAVEIARVLGQESNDQEGHRPLPVPDSVKKLARDRVDGLSALAREAVLVAASLSRPTIEMVVAALPSESDPLQAVLEAETAGVLLTERDRVRFTHPLLASAVYGSASDARRRQLHGRLAEIVMDTEERARHLAQSAIEADECTAAKVEEAADQAALRGAFDTAVELFEAACRLTPRENEDACLRRRLGQASSLLRSGDVGGARLLAQDAETDGMPLALQAERLQLLAEIEWDDGVIGQAVAYLEQALAAACDDPGLSARISARLVLLAAPGDPARAREHAERAVQHARGDREPAVLSSLLIDLCLLDLLLGRSPRTDLMERGIALEAEAGSGVHPHPVPLIWFQCTDDVDATRARYERELAWARDHGAEPHGAERLSYLALVEFHAGRWDLADRLIEESCKTIEERLEVSGRFAFPFAWRAFMDAHHGRLVRARATLEPLVEETLRGAKAWWAAILLSTLGFVQFAAGDVRAADRALTQMRELLDEIGIEDGLLDRTEPFHIELLVQLGQTVRAREILARLEQRAEIFPRLWIDVALPRARAIVLAAEGDTAAALEALDALDPEQGARLPFELACALLTSGRLLRRAKQRRAAGHALTEALDIFERLGAPIWAEQTRGELEVVGPRRRTSDELTASELRVAELAATGITNREIAQVAFMSDKTVEAHLARAYRKLGIRSRAELGALMAKHPARDSLTP